MDAAAGRLGASDGDLNARPLGAPEHYGAGCALRSGLCLTERVWLHLAVNHTVMHAKPAPLGITRSVMTRGSASTNLNNKKTPALRLKTAWQPAHADPRLREIE